jgi:hypothetical protein
MTLPIHQYLPAGDMQRRGDEVEGMYIGEVFGHEGSLYRFDTDRLLSCRADAHPNDTAMIRQSGDLMNLGSAITND